jgi:hypothetical protein
MTNVAVRALGAAALLGGLLACGEPVAPGVDDSRLVAAVAGAYDLEYKGSSHFHPGGDPRRPYAPSYFSLVSEGRGASAGQSVLLTRGNPEIPEPGTYVIGPLPHEMQAFYNRIGAGGQTVESFRGETGTVVITHATPQRLEGTFEFSGYQICDRDASSGMFCVIGPPPGPETERVHVSGSFVAYPRSQGIGGIRTP